MKKTESKLKQLTGNPEKTSHGADELSLFQDINTALNSAAGLDEVLEAIAGGMVKVFGYTGSLVFLDEEGKGEAITLKAFAYDYKPRIIKKIEKILGFSLKGHEFNPEKDHTIHRLYSEKLPLISNDISGSLAGLFRSGIYRKLVSEIAGLLPVASALLVPLLVGRKVKGILVVAGQREMNGNDVSRVQTLTIQASLAIEKTRLLEEETRQRRINETLYTVAQVIGSTLELDDLLHRILGQLQKVMDCRAAAIMLVDERREQLYVKVVEGFSKEAVKISLPLDGERGIGVEVVRTGEPQYVPDMAKDKRHVSGGINCGSELAVPLKIRDEVIGVLNLESEEINAFSRYDLQLLSALAGQAGIAIENARLFEAEQSRRRLAETLGEVSRAVGSILDLDNLLLMILEQLKKILAYDTASIMLFSGQKPSFAATLGYNDKELVSREMPLCLQNSPIFEKMVRTRRPIIIRDVREEKDWIWVPGASHVCSWIGMPLIAGNEVIGALSIDSNQAGFFTGKDVEAVQALANQTAMAIENARLFKDLNESEERFRDVSANTGDWVWEVDGEGRYTYSSPVVAQILGYTPQEVLGKYFYDFFFPEDREKLKSEAFNVFQMRKPFTALINRNLHKDGHTVILETSATPVIAPEGQFKGYRGADHDITARLQAEQALASSEHKYRILVEHTDDWIWTLDLKGNFTFFNRAAEEASGYLCEEWVGRSFVPIILPEDLPGVNKIYSQILAGNSKSYEVRVLNKEGKLLTLAVNTAPLYEGGRIVGTVSMGRDVSRHKQLEDQLRQAQKMEAIGTLAGGIAHDFNNILAGILGYTSLIKTEISDNETLLKELDAVISLVHRAAELTSQLLGFARGGSYKTVPINLNDIIDEVLELLSRTIDKAICIKPVLNPALAAIEGDAGQIQQVIMNLCLNARDEMPGGGELLIETENIDVDEDSAGAFLGLEAGSYVLLSVSDTGSGMDSETIKRIFDPFFTTKAGKGMNKHSGLGLSMVYGIVHSHGGIIRIYSEIEEGSTFKVYLPATERKIIKKENEEKTPVGGKETILLIDDEDLILEPAEKILKQAGYKVLPADGGRKALKLFSKFHKKIELVILDMIMPDMNGTATYKALMEIDPGVKVLLSSGYSRNGQAQELLDSGVKDFLQKPYEFADMLIKVRQVLDGE